MIRTRTLSHIAELRWST